MKTIKGLIIEKLLARIDEEENKLDVEDCEGHIWWNKFREFIKNQPL
jgi:hypothetical protein